MDIREEIIDFIDSKENNGVLLLTGSWGCGKSFFIKNIIKQLNEGSKYAITIISLFGIDSIATINARVKEEYLEKHSGLLGKSAKEIYKVLTTAIKESASVLEKLSPESTTAVAISTGANSVASINPFNAIPVKNKVGIGNKKKQFVLIFDDFERCRLSRIDLLGAINEYTENREIKTLLIADEGKILNDYDEKIKKEYKEFKEKVVARTIKMSPDYKNVISSIIESYEETKTGYTGFLHQNVLLIEQLFLESKTENLRSLKAFLTNYERIYDACREAKISLQDECSLLYMFGAITFAAKCGRIYKDIDGVHINNLEMKEIYEKWNSNHILSSLNKWILEGVWNRKDFLTEIKKKFHVGNMTYEERFIILDLWDLEQIDIEEGMPIAVTKAYTGELTCNELILLLQKVAALKKYSVQVSIDVDYPKIYSGFNMRKKKIFLNQIQEPQRSIYSEKSQIEDAAYDLYDQIIHLEDEIIAYNNRQKFINYLDQDPNIQGYSLTNMAISAFDDDLLAIFIAKYCHSNNHKKCELERVLLHLNFIDGRYTTNEDKEKTIKNFESLIKTIEKINISINKSITIAINNRFVQNINEFIKKIQNN